MLLDACYLAGSALHDDVPTARVELLAVEAVITNVGLHECAVVHDLLGSIGDESEVVEHVFGGILEKTTVSI